jgi:hypothetical protein
MPFVERRITLICSPSLKLKKLRTGMSSADKCIVCPGCLVRKGRDRATQLKPNTFAGFGCAGPIAEEGSAKYLAKRSNSCLIWYASSRVWQMTKTFTACGLAALGRPAPPRAEAKARSCRAPESRQRRCALTSLSYRSASTQPCDEGGKMASSYHSIGAR